MKHMGPKEDGKGWYPVTVAGEQGTREDVMWGSGKVSLDQMSSVGPSNFNLHASGVCGKTGTVPGCAAYLPSPWSTVTSWTSCFSNSWSCLWKPRLGLAQDLPARTVCRASSQPKSVTVMMYAITSVTLLETPARLWGQENGPWARKV